MGDARASLLKFEPVIVLRRSCQLRYTKEQTHRCTGTAILGSPRAVARKYLHNLKLRTTLSFTTTCDHHRKQNIHILTVRSRQHRESIIFFHRQVLHVFVSVCLCFVFVLICVLLCSLTLCCLFLCLVFVCVVLCLVMVCCAVLSCCLTIHKQNACMMKDG